MPDRAEQGSLSSEPPRDSLAAVFLRFLKFGALAWGGPAAQIAMIRRELVEREGWVDGARFNRVLAVYQALPGPEAFELCCYFGMTRRGRVGAVLAGLGFMLPGLILMLLAAWLYVRYGMASPMIVALFAGVQPTVAAMMANAAVHLGRKALGAPWLWGCAVLCAAGQVCAVPFWIPLGVCAIAGWLRSRAPRAALWLLAMCAVGVSAWAGWNISRGEADPAHMLRPDFEPRGADVGGTFAPEYLWTGLKAGLLTFGGAYTAVPVVRDSAVYTGSLPWESGWMSHEQFLDGLAIGGVLPAPLVIFCTFVGFVGGEWLGATLMTLGVFAPAFSFTLIGHGLFERIVDDKRWHSALDGVAAGVIGVLAVAAVQTASVALREPWHTAVFACAWMVLLRFKRAWTIPFVIALAAAAGLARSWWM